MKEYLPSATFHLRELNNKNEFEWCEIETKDLFSNKKIIIFSLPGAFTPTCSTFQMPGFEKLFQEFTNLGVNSIYCISVNDAFVMNEWGKKHNINNLKLIPDGNSEFTRKMGMLVEKNNLGFGLRSWRYAVICENYKITNWFVENFFSDNYSEDPYDKTKPENILEFLKNK